MNVDIVSSQTSFEFRYSVVVVGGGGCGLTAALAASDIGVDVLVLEQDRAPMGTTAMSTGLIPAAGTAEQSVNGIDDSPQQFATDIQAKSGGGADPDVVKMLTEESAESIVWLRDTHGVPLTLVEGFLYPGHTYQRMYGSPKRTGAELMAALETACANHGVDVLTEALVEDLIVDSGKKVLGVRVTRPDGSQEEIGCDALILACCGFAGNAEMVAKYTPDMINATFHGHPGNKGHAIKWGEALGAALHDITAYQGHGGLAHGYGIPILWPLIMEGGFQVNRQGLRFSNESKGYSEQAVNVLKQADNVAWSVFDQRLYNLMLEFEDFRDAVSAGAITHGDSIVELANQIKVSETGLQKTLNAVEACANGEELDEYGRDFTQKPALKAPYYAAKVTGALFHTQGGLSVNREARVVDTQGNVFPNLFAGGGAARGISGNDASGYIAGNGLLTAIGLGKVAGRVAAAQINSSE